MKKEIIIEQNISKRVDIYLSEILSENRNKILNLIKDGSILCNGKIIKPSYKPKIKDSFTIEYKDENFVLTPYKVDLDILYEDEYYAIINKPKNMVVHPGAAKEKNTLTAALLNRYGYDGLSNINGEERLGIVHRLDKDTSGAIIIAKTNIAHEKMANLIQNREIHKEYLAYVKGIIKSEGKINAPIGRHYKYRTKYCINSNGKNALTYYKPIFNIDNNTMISCLLITGRTHQIRVHMSSINHPIIGDPLYGKANNKYQSPVLHAYKLKFIHPIIQKNIIVIAKPTEDIEKLFTIWYNQKNGGNYEHNYYNWKTIW